MELETIENFFLWCTVINTGIYIITAIAIMTMRNFIYSIHHKLFHLDEAAIDKLFQNYLANFKLLITIFNFTPWIAILIIK